MISFYVDPQWCGVLFSVYWKNEKGYLFTGGTTPQLDPLVSTAFAEPLDVDWITFAGSVGLEFYHLSSSWAVVFDTAKVTGVLVLLGFGSLVGYRILKYLWLSRFSDSSEPPSPSVQQHNVKVSMNNTQLMEEDDESTDLSDVEGRYFGPDPVPANHGLVGMLCMHLNKLTKSLSGIRKRNINMCLESVCTAATCKSHSCSRGAQRKIISRHDRLKSENLMPFLLWLQESCHCPHDLSPSDATCDLGWLVKKIMHLEDCESSYLHGKKLNEYLQQNASGFRDTAKLSDNACHSTPPSAARNNSFLPRYCREDSYDFSVHTRREGSFDSTCSEFSLDFTLPESCENTNIINLDKLQQEIDKLKSNCQMMDEELEIIKCNRNLPGLSSLMETNVSENNLASNDDGSQINSTSNETLKQQNARACFAGLYSLTTIQNSMSDLSDFSESGNRMVESTESLDWDSPQSIMASVDVGNKVPGKLSPRPHRSKDNYNETKQDDCVSELNSSLPKVSVSKYKFPSNDEDGTIDLEWDEDDLVSNVNDGDENFNKLDLDGVSWSTANTNTELNNFIFQNTRCKDDHYKLHVQNATNDDSLEQDPSFSPNLNSDAVMNASRYSKESGYLEWDEAEFSLQESCGVVSVQSSPDCDILPSSNSSTALYMPNVQYVGSRTNIYKYALQVCRRSSEEEETLLKGFAEIPSFTGLQNLRHIHRDSYCIIRAAIFQGLVHHCPIPCGRSAFQSLSEIFDNYNFTWLQNWDFASYLPYEGKEVLHGMRMCLHTLDNVMSVLASREDSEDTLALLLNSDRSLDVHVMEAVKLHLLLQTIKLYQSYTSGGSIPGFVESMFALESFRTPKEFMYNHLQNMGKSTKLHEMVFSLLGYTLNMKICVIHPAFFGTDQFVSYFPQSNIGSPHEVVLIDDEDNYSVLAH